jgi:hypothetical protein
VFADREVRREERAEFHAGHQGFPDFS